MAQRCILKTRAQMDGAIRDPGYVFILPTGVRGPHRATRAAHDQINNATGLYERLDNDRGEDEPLYDVLEEIPDVENPTLAQKIRVKQAELETVRREEIEAKRIELEGTGPRSTELAKEIRDMQAQHRAELREPPGTIDKGNLAIPGETEAETQKRIHAADKAVDRPVDLESDAQRHPPGAGIPAGLPGQAAPFTPKPAFQAPEPPVVKTVPPLVGQSAAPPPAPGKPGVAPIAPAAPAPSKPIMAQPADAPAEKGKTERLDGSF
jgi:hypothetical protein